MRRSAALLIAIASLSMPPPDPRQFIYEPVVPRPPPPDKLRELLTKPKRKRRRGRR